MKKRLLALILTFVMCLSSVPAIVFADTATDETIDIYVEATTKQAAARSMFSLVNDLRTNPDTAWQLDENEEQVYLTDLSELTYDYGLEQIARQRAMELVVSYAHTRPNGGNPFSCVIDDVQTYGENIAVFSERDNIVNAVFTGWAEENEPYAGQGHRRNMLNKNFKAIGIACVEYEGFEFWVQEFGYSASGMTDPLDVNDMDPQLKTFKVETLVSTLGTFSAKTDDSRPELYLIAEMDTIDVPAVNITFTNPHWEYTKPVVKHYPDWVSSDESIVKVEEGMLKAQYDTDNKIIQGDVTISATVAGKSVSEEVTVKCWHDFVTDEVTGEEVSEVIVEPTYTTTGLIRYTCTKCGVVDEVLPNLVDGNAKIEGRQIALTDGIEYRTVVLRGEDALDTDYMHVSIEGGKTFDIKFSEATQIGTDFITGKAMYYFKIPLYATQMRSEITMQMFVNGHGGTKVTTTVYDYAMEIITSQGYADSMKELVKAMLNYGGYAQKAFGVNTDKLANENIFKGSDRDPIIAGGYTISGSSMSKSWLGDLNGGFKFTSASLVLDTNVGVRYYYTIDDNASIEEYTVSLTENSSSFTIKKGYDKKAGSYYLQIDGINPTQYDKLTEVKVEDSDGSYYIIGLPVNYFVLNALNTDGWSTEFKQLMIAMSLYGNEATTYANSYPNIGQL